MPKFHPGEFPPPRNANRVPLRLTSVRKSSKVSSALILVAALASTAACSMAADSASAKRPARTTLTPSIVIVPLPGVERFGLVDGKSAPSGDGADFGT
jgi:hypothetical protein